MNIQPTYMGLYSSSRVSIHFTKQAIQQRMVGAKYVWVLMGDYSDTWWRVNDNAISCDESHFERGLEGYIATDILPITTSKDITISDLVSCGLRNISLQLLVWRVNEDLVEATLKIAKF